MNTLDIIQPRNSTTLFLGSGNSLRQTFIPHIEPLSGIRLPLFNPLLGGKKTFLFSISESNGKVIRSAIVSESNLGWGNMFRFDFDPIQNVRGNTLTFEIAPISEEKTDALLLTQHNQSRIYKTPSKSTVEVIDPLQKRHISIPYFVSDVYPEGKAFLENKELPGDIEFYTTSQISLKQYFPSRVRFLGEKLRSDSIFLLIYGTLILLCICVLFRRGIYALLRKRSDR
jgi:hypothetical protein